MTMIQVKDRDIESAFNLAKGFMSRWNKQPIEPTREEVLTLCVIVLFYTTQQTLFNMDELGDLRILMGGIPTTERTRKLYENSRDTPVFTDNLAHLNYLTAVLDQDRSALFVNDPAYDASWKKREGHSAFENLCRKWDRAYARIKKHAWDVFEACRLDTRREGVIGDLRDLRRYLALIECELISRGYVAAETATKDTEVPTFTGQV